MIALNDSFSNELATVDGAIEQQLDSECTVNDMVSYTNNFECFHNCNAVIFASASNSHAVNFLT